MGRRVCVKENEDVDEAICVCAFMFVKGKWKRFEVV